MKRAFYLDSCILIAYFSDSKEEGNKKKQVKLALNALENIQGDYDYFISKWCIAEMMNILLSRHKMKNEDVLKIESELINKRRLGALKIKIIDIEGKNQGYDLEEFFYDLREMNLKYHSGVGDMMHAVIMNNNNVDYVLTFDEKEDFKKISGLVVLHPKDMKVRDLK